METNKNNRLEKVARFIKRSFIVVIAISVIIALAGIVTGKGKSSTPSTAAAYVVSKAFVKAKLEYPEEASFASMPVLSQIQEDTDGLYRVVGEVTYSNAFGVKSKTRYLIRMRFKDGQHTDPSNWEVVDFDFVN